MSSKQVNEFVKKEDVVFIMLASMKVNTKFVLDKLLVVSDFP